MHNKHNYKLVMKIHSIALSQKQTTFIRILLLVVTFSVWCLPEHTFVYICVLLWKLLIFSPPSALVIPPPHGIGCIFNCYLGPQSYKAQFLLHGQESFLWQCSCSRWSKAAPMSSREVNLRDLLVTHCWVGQHPQHTPPSRNQHLAVRAPLVCSTKCQSALNGAACSACLSWKEADEVCLSRKVLLPAGRQQTLHTVSGLLLASTSQLNISCRL